MDNMNPKMPEPTGDAIVDRERRMLWNKERGQNAMDELVSQESESDAEEKSPEEDAYEGLTQESLVGIQIRKWAFETAMESLPDNTLNDILVAADAIALFVLAAELPEDALEPETGAGEPTEGPQDAATRFNTQMNDFVAPPEYGGNIL